MDDYFNIISFFFYWQFQHFPLVVAASPLFTNLCLNTVCTVCKDPELWTFLIDCKSINFPLIHLSTVDSVGKPQIYNSTSLPFSTATNIVAGGGLTWLWHGARPTAQLFDPETTDIST